jgi:hypothetical protein
MGGGGGGEGVEQISSIQKMAVFYIYLFHA